MEDVVAFDNAESEFANRHIGKTFTDWKLISVDRSMEIIIPIVFVFFILFILIAIVGSNVTRQRELAMMTVVNPGIEYPNNHHVLGVGYYHAAVHRWFPHPWNEYREDRGYYWDGAWQATPDQRMILKSTPSASEVDRVNQEWRHASPELARQFWNTVEHEGFGTAIRRSEGS